MKNLKMAAIRATLDIRTEQFLQFGTILPLGSSLIQHMVRKLSFKEFQDCYLGYRDGAI